MSRERPDKAAATRGASRLVVDAARAVTSIVEALHRAIGGGPSHPRRRADRLSDKVYDGIRGVTDLVGSGIDIALDQLAPLLDEAQPGPEREAALAVLNGVLGDHLEETGNPLAIEMCLRREGQALELDDPDELRRALPDASGTLLVLVHGSCLTDRQWQRNGHDHGAALARDLGCTPVYALYNSGLHVSTNGRSLAALLDQLVAAWPVAVERVVIVAHSMGGLVARSACHHAEIEGRPWRDKLRAMVFLGTPHHGAALERGGNKVDLLLGASPYSAPFARLGQIRSAGVTDLRYGNVLDQHWKGRDRFAAGGDERRPLPLPRGVACFAVAASLAGGPGPPWVGDGLVSVSSALGVHDQDPSLTLDFAASHQLVVSGAAHLDLLDRPEVYTALRDWLAALDGLGERAVA